MSDLQIAICSAPIRPIADNPSESPHIDSIDNAPGTASKFMPCNNLIELIPQLDCMLVLSAKKLSSVAMFRDAGKYLRTRNAFELQGLRCSACKDLEAVGYAIFQIQ